MSNQCQGQIDGRAEVFMDVNHVGNLERGSLKCGNSLHFHSVLNQYCILLHQQISQG